MPPSLRQWARPLLRAVHPDLFHDARRFTPAVRDTNAKSLKLLNAIIDALDHGTALPGEVAAATAPGAARGGRGGGCELEFHMLPSGERASATLRLPSSMLRPATRGGGGLEPTSPALLSMLLQKQLKPLLRSAAPAEKERLARGGGGGGEGEPSASSVLDELDDAGAGDGDDERASVPEKILNSYLRTRAEAYPELPSRRELRPRAPLPEATQPPRRLRKKGLYNQVRSGRKETR